MQTKKMGGGGVKVVVCVKLSTIESGDFSFASE